MKYRVRLKETRYGSVTVQARSPEEAKLLAQNPSKICVGPVSLHADHCMILVQNELDRREAQ